MKKLIVFLRHNNDIDHITPILYKMLTTTTVPMDIIVTTSKQLLSDYRVAFLRTIAKRTSNVQFYYFGFWKKRQSFIEYYLQQHAGSVVCFDWKSDAFTRSVCAIAKQYDCTTVALPHGDEPYWNKIQRDDNITYEQANKPYEQRNFFDYIVVPNKLCAHHYPFMNKKHIKVLGSPRYCTEWIRIHNTIKPNTPSFNHNDKKLKVVLFLRNQHFPINWHEIIVTIKLITQFKDAFLVVRNHPRGKLSYDFVRNHPWLTMVPNVIITDDINSSSLIDWADVVFDVGTSVTWESIKNNKPTYMLEHLQANESTVAHYIPSSVIHSRDDIVNILRTRYANRQSVWCPEKRRQKFISAMIEYPDKNVLERYVNFLEGLYDKSKTKTKK